MRDAPIRPSVYANFRHGYHAPVESRHSYEPTSAGGAYELPATRRLCGPDTVRLKTDLDILLRRFGRLAWRYGLVVAINNLRPFAFCRKARCKHQLSNGFDRRRIGTRETGDVTLGDE